MKVARNRGDRSILPTPLPTSSMEFNLVQLLHSQGDNAAVCEFWSLRSWIVGECQFLILKSFVLALVNFAGSFQGLNVVSISPVMPPNPMDFELVEISTVLLGG